MKIIDTLIEAGADALELGIPFSDPLADGPTIQNATLRAFAAGVTPEQCFEMLALIRQKHPTIPIGLVDVAPIWCLTKALMSFMPSARKSASIRCWLPMCQLKSPRPFRGAALRHNVAPIFICPPNADDDLLRQIASYGRGFTPICCHERA